MISDFFNTYAKHLIKKSFYISALVWVVMVFLDLSITLVMELENLSDDLSFRTILSTVLLEQPHKGIQYLESSMLIGTLITLSLFNQQGNLVFLRSSGFSPLKIVLISGIGPLMVSSLLIFMNEIAFLEMSQVAKNFNQATQEQSIEPLQWELSNQNLIGLQRITNTEAAAIQIIEFDEQDKIISNSSYETGNLNEGKLLIASPASELVFDFPSSLLLKESALEKLTLRSLLRLKTHYQLADDSQKIESLIYGRLFLPISIIAIIFLAGSLMFGAVRSGGVGRQIIIGISLGLIYDLAKDLSIASFLTYQWSILLAHILPIIILIGLGCYKFQKV